MKTENKYRLLIAGLVVCISGLIAQSLYLWRLEHALVDASAGSDIPDRIQQRLDALAGPDPGLNLFDLNNWGGPSIGVNPFSRMQQIQQQMDSVFANFGVAGSGFSTLGGVSFSNSSPNLSLDETDHEYLVNVQTPPNEEIIIDTELDQNLLVITGTSTRKQVAGGSSFTSRSQFSRSFDLPKPVDELGIFTEPHEGGLLIHVPKKS